MKSERRHFETQLCLAVAALSLCISGCSNAGRSANETIRVGPAARTGSEQLATARGGPATGKREAKLETVALFDGRAMPTGVTVSRTNRIFLCFPRWADKVEATVVELHNGQLVAFPDAATSAYDPSQPDKLDPRTHLVSVQSVVVDSTDRLWLLDPGSINLGPVIDGAPKLWAYDLLTGDRVKEIKFPNDVALKHTYLNDIRFDLKRGSQGMAYITDSGMGGIIVVDLATGQSWRHLDDHPSVLPTPGLMQMSEGQPLLQRKPTGEVAGPPFHSDGIALSPNGATLYYTTIASHDVWSVPTDLLADRSADEKKIAAAVKKIASKPSGNDGLICDAQGRIYSSDFEDNCIRQIDSTTGKVTVLAQDERLLWPDTFAIHEDQLYVTSNQLARQPNYHGGDDQRKPPYALFRLQIDSGEKMGPAK